jgi:pyruvate carboxylase subunit B
VPQLADTTIRLLGQEPLAGRIPTADLLELVEILDGAGYAYLEVSGGGVFDSAVRRGVESPWERIRALATRTSTPLGLALRGRLLVGSKPVDNEFVRRFVASAAENGIDVFRLNDPLNDVSNLADAAEAIAALMDAAGGGPEPGTERIAANERDRADYLAGSTPPASPEF